MMERLGAVSPPGDRQDNLLQDLSLNHDKSVHEQQIPIAPEHHTHMVYCSIMAV